MTFAQKLQYAGASPYEPERNRRDISHAELEKLEEDETYRKLAEVRWLANELELELDRDSVPDEVADHMFTAIAERDAPLRQAVEAYVDAWLEAHRERVGAEA